jgi:hypothetical protein
MHRHHGDVRIHVSLAQHACPPRRIQRLGDLPTPVRALGLGERNVPARDAVRDRHESAGGPAEPAGGQSGLPVEGEQHVQPVRRHCRRLHAAGGEMAGVLSVEDLSATVRPPRVVGAVRQHIHVLGFERASLRSGGERRERLFPGAAAKRITTAPQLVSGVRVHDEARAPLPATMVKHMSPAGDAAAFVGSSCSLR